MAKLRIYTGLPKPTPKLSHPCLTCIIAKGIQLPRHPNVSTENLDPGTRFHLDFRFFHKVSWQKFTSTLTIVDTTTRHYINLQVVKKDQTHPKVPHLLLSPIIMSMNYWLNDQFIHQ